MMRVEMRSTTCIGLICSATALVAAAAVSAATTDTITVRAVVAAGTTLSVAGTGSPTFALTLNGADQTTSYTLPVAVIDARGLAAGGGWNLTVTSTQFNAGSGHVFPTTASTITGVSAACGAGSTCTLPTNSISNTNLALPSGSVAPTAVKFYNAATATGLGTSNVSATVSVAVPANVFQGTYTSTVTVSIVAGP
jgi:WxL domain surface cell wall-binding